MISGISRELPVVIMGPTASGKSGLALALAARDGRVVVNADALQVYGCWRVLSARPTRAEEAVVPHALYGHVGAAQSYSVGHWLREVAPLLGAGVVIVGGTGLYLSALTQGLVEIPAVSAAVRAEADLRRAKGLGALLADLDAATLARIDRANPARVQRAWEVWHSTGRGLAAWQDQTGAALLPRAGVEALVLRPSVEWLNARIDARFDAMIAAGALGEVAGARAGWDPALPSSRAIGAAELLAHLEGRVSLADAVVAAKLASRQYAKRQRTWGRSRMKDWREIVPG